MDSLTSSGESIDDDWEYVEVMSCTKRGQVNHHQSYPASAVNDRQWEPTVHNGPAVNQDAPVVKIFHVFQIVATGAYYPKLELVAQIRTR